MRKVKIDDRTEIFTESEESDEVVREKFLEKIERGRKGIAHGNNMTKQSFEKKKGKYE